MRLGCDQYRTLHLSPRIHNTVFYTPKTNQGAQLQQREGAQTARHLDVMVGYVSGASPEAELGRAKGKGLCLPLPGHSSPFIA